MHICMFISMWTYVFACVCVSQRFAVKSSTDCVGKDPAGIQIVEDSVMMRCFVLRFLSLPENSRKDCSGSM